MNGNIIGFGSKKKYLKKNCYLFQWQQPGYVHVRVMKTILFWRFMESGEENERSLLLVFFSHALFHSWPCFVCGKLTHLDKEHAQYQRKKNLPMINWLQISKEKIFMFFFWWLICYTLMEWVQYITGRILWHFHLLQEISAYYPDQSTYKP